MSSTNLDMACDEDYHGKRVLLPRQKENYNEKENISSLHDENKVLNLQWTVYKSIF